MDDRGLYCAAGGFHIDPWRPVDCAVITHAHADHARAGSKAYIAAAPGAEILRHRLGQDLPLQALPFGESMTLGRTEVSLHPAGHVLGSAQVRVACRDTGAVWVATGDYKRALDPTCRPFEPVACDVLITEATFALPVYRWPNAADIAREIVAFWRENRAAGRCTVLFCYALGKAQRLLAEIGAVLEATGGPQHEAEERIWLHGAITRLTELYREAGVALPATSGVSDAESGHDFEGALALAPPSAAGTPWMRRFKPYRTAFASGWMRVRGNRRRRSVDRGFPLSDHTDWPGLLQTIRESGARRVLVTHGHADVVVRYLNEELGIDAEALATAFTDLEEDVPTQEQSRS